MSFLNLCAIQAQEASRVKTELVAHTGPAVCVSRNCLELKIEMGLSDDL